MSGYARQLLLLTLAMIGAVFVTKAVYAWPGLFPVALKILGNAIVDAMGATTAESSSNIEVTYVFAVSWLFVFLVLAIVSFTWSHFQKKK